MPNRREHDHIGQALPGISDVLGEVGTALARTQRALTQEAAKVAPGGYYQNIAEADVEIKASFNISSSGTEDRKLKLMLLNSYTKHRYDLTEKISSTIKVKFVATPVELPPVNLEEEDIEHVVTSSKEYKELLKKHKKLTVNKVYLAGQGRWLVEIEKEPEKTRVATLFVNDRNGELEK